MSCRESNPPVVDSPAPLQPADENDLLQRARQGDEAAFGRLMQAYHGYVFRLVWAIVRHDHDAADICQEVWLTVWQKLPTFAGTGKFSTWLHPIATRRALDHLRKRRRWFDRFLPFATSPEGPPVEPAADGDPRDDVAGSELRDRLDGALAALPPLHRTVLALREIQGLSYQEIARTVRIPAGTVMSRLYHARRLLAQKLKEPR